MASAQEIKRRVRSLNRTKQITHALELVSASRLRKARDRLEGGRLYYQGIGYLVSLVLAQVQARDFPFPLSPGVASSLCLVIASNRGLAGGYNINVAKEVEDLSQKEDLILLLAGRRGRPLLQRRGLTITKEFTYPEEPSLAAAQPIAQKVMELCRAKEIKGLYLVFNRFVSQVQQLPTVLQLLPLPPGKKGRDPHQGGPFPELHTIEPDGESLLKQLIPHYLAANIYGALLEAAASEHAARLMAMRSATESSAEMLEDLELKLNRLRQAAITREIAEILGGGGAL